VSSDPFRERSLEGEFIDTLVDDLTDSVPLPSLPSSPPPDLDSKPIPSFRISFATLDTGGKYPVSPPGWLTGGKYPSPPPYLDPSRSSPRTCTGAPTAGFIHGACGQNAPGVIVTPGVIATGPLGVIGIGTLDIVIVTPGGTNPGDSGIIIPGESGIPGENM
jgi:hypothetical protein